MMDIEIRDEEDAPYGAFRAYDEQGALGSMVYVHSAPKVVIVQHTGILGRGRGQGVGRMLFHHLVAWARETNTKVVPQCPFTRKEFDKHPETRDVLR
ncbi:MAG: putative GNAT family acetyltransferase [Myxococcota bacterium]|jgi:predicted GNAT family acetyltransferase